MSKQGTISLIGAGKTGKSNLARALCLHLARAGIPATHVEAGLAPSWRERFVQASRSGIVVLEGSPLALAVACGTHNGSAAVTEGALAEQSSYALTLLAALAPVVPDAAAEDVEAQLRAALTQGAVNFSVLHGNAAQRLATAWSAVQSALGMAEQTGAVSSRPWRWNCDKCSDPDCEHRVFTELVGARR